MAVFGPRRHEVPGPPGRASLRSYLMLLQRHTERGLPLGRSAESPQKWRGMAVFHRNSSICTLIWPGGSWIGARETLSLVSLPPSSFGLHPSLERQSRAGWSPQCAGCSGAITHPGAEGAAHLHLLLSGRPRIRFTSKPSGSHWLPRSPWERRPGRSASLALSMGRRGASKTAFPRRSVGTRFRKLNHNPGHVLRSICAMIAAVEVRVFGRVSTDASAHGRLTSNSHSVKAQSNWRW